MAGITEDELRSNTLLIIYFFSHYCWIFSLIFYVHHRQLRRRHNSDFVTDPIDIWNNTDIFIFQQVLTEGLVHPDNFAVREIQTLTVNCRHHIEHGCKWNGPLKDIDRHIKGNTTRWAEGVPVVTQCPMSPGNWFCYHFYAMPVGMYCYHSHTIFWTIIVPNSQSSFEYKHLNYICRKLVKDNKREKTMVLLRLLCHPGGNVLVSQSYHLSKKQRSLWRLHYQGHIILL